MNFLQQLSTFIYLPIKALCKKMILLFIFLNLAIFANLSLAGEQSVSQKTVKIPLLDWTSQKVISKAIGIYLQKHNYKVTYLNMTEDKLWGSLSRGRVHFQIEVWQSYDHLLQSFVKKNRIADLGKHSVNAIEEWWYPKYVEQLCPGLPDWKALLKCSNIFSKPGSTKGVYHIGPWDYQDANLIRSLKLDFKIERHEDVNEIWAELESAYLEKKPILLLNWTPNWVDQRIPGNFVKFPAHHPECLEKASWGVNPDLTHDCGNPKNGWIKKAAWSRLSTSLPCVYSLIDNMDLNNKMIAEAAALVKYDKYTEGDAAQIWLNTFQKSVNKWADEQCMGIK